MTDALTPAVGDVGEFWARRDPDGDAYVLRADPVIAVSVELIGNAALGGLANASYDAADRMLTFRAANGTWRYRVGDRIDGLQPTYRGSHLATLIEGTDDPSVPGSNTTTPATEAAETEEENDGS